MPLFLVSRGALRVIKGQNQVAFHHSAGFQEAASAAEAEGLQLRELRREKPDIDGWQGHDVLATEIPIELLERAIAKAKGEGL